MQDLQWFMPYRGPVLQNDSSPHVLLSSGYGTGLPEAIPVNFSRNFRDDVSLWVHGTQVYINPAWLEQIGIQRVEALSCAGNCGDITELVRRHENLVQVTRLAADKFLERHPEYSGCPVTEKLLFYVLNTRQGRLDFVDTVRELFQLLWDDKALLNRVSSEYSGSEFRDNDSLLYKFHQRIGQGTFFDVFTASPEYCSDSQKAFAITCKSEGIEKGKKELFLLRYFELLGLPYIQRSPFSSLLAPSYLCFLSELYRGNLSDLIEQPLLRGEHIPAVIISRMCKQIMEGLCYLGASGIVHGDVKPDNLFLDESYNIVIGDFGSGAIAGDTLCPGSFCNASPEIWGSMLNEASAPPAMPDQDVWAAGFTMLCIIEAFLKKIVINDSYLGKLMWEKKQEAAQKKEQDFIKEILKSPVNNEEKRFYLDLLSWSVRFISYFPQERLTALYQFLERPSE